MLSKNKRLIVIICIVAAILAVPLVAMQFTSEVNWDLSDFVIMGILLLGTGLACELVLRTLRNTRYRAIICLAVLSLLLLTWAELAVGIFGTPFAGS